MAITKKSTVVPGDLSPFRLKPAQASIQNPDIEFERLQALPIHRVTKQADVEDFVLCVTVIVRSYDVLWGHAVA
jgi:hypothetical protein